MLLAASAEGDEEAPGTHINPVPSLTYSEWVWEFFMENGEIHSVPIKVQQFRDGKAVLCFKFAAVRWPYCFYRNSKTGQVVVQQTISNSEAI